MPIDLLALAAELITSEGLELIKDKAQRDEKVLSILNRFPPLKPDAPPNERFDGVYAYTLVQYGASTGKPKPLIEFFRHPFIKKAFWQSFETRDPSYLEEESENFLDWSPIAKELLSKVDYDPRQEFAEFREQFISAAKLTRTVQEIRTEHAIDDISKDIQKLPTKTDLTSEIAPLGKRLDDIFEVVTKPLPISSLYNNLLDERKSKKGDNNKASHIFISYARTEAQYAEWVVRDLRSQGYKIWIDTRQILPEQDVTSDIERSIQLSSHFVVCLTADIKRYTDRYVHREIAYALQQGIPIIPIVFPGGELPLLISTWLPIVVSNDDDYPVKFRQLLDYLHNPNQQLQKPLYPNSPSLVTYLNSLHSWISDRIAESVFNLISLEAVSAPNAVLERSEPKPITFNFSVSPALKVSSEKKEPVSKPKSDESKRLFEKFSDATKYYKDELLLLGEPGSGKTTTLLAYARDKVVERLYDPTKPIPILASIHTWGGEKNIPQWAKSQIGSVDFGSEEILYLLDGLDELGSKKDALSNSSNTSQNDPRVDFIEALGTHLANSKVIVTCRIQDYFQINQKVSLLGAVTLEPLDDSKVKNYLYDRSRLWLWEILESDPSLKDMARNPLLLGLMTFAIETKDDYHTRLDGNRINEEELFDGYIRRRFIHEKSKRALPFSEAQTRLLLGALATYMWKDWWSPKAALILSEIKKIIGNDADAFIMFCEQMHFMKHDMRNNFQFIHLKLRDYFAVSGLVNNLRDRKESNRENSIWALGQIGSPSSAKGLFRALSDKSEHIRLVATWALGQIGDKSTIYALIETLRENNSLYSTVTSSLMKIGQQGVTLLAEYSNDSDATIREAVIAALRNMGETAAKELVLQLAHPGRSKRKIAATVLKELNWTPSDKAMEAKYLVASEQWSQCVVLGEDAVSALLVALKDQSELIRTEAAKALGQIGSEAAVSGLLDALKDKDTYTRTEAAKALGEIGSEAAVSGLLDALKDNNEFTRTAATKALGQIGSEAAVSGLLDALKDKNTYTRTEAAKALGEIGSEAAVSGLLDALKDDNEFTRTAAAKALGQIGSEAAVSGLLDALKDENVYVHTAIISSLRKISMKATLPTIIQMILKGDRNIQSIATDLLKTISSSNTDDVINLLGHEKRQIRIIASTILREMDWTPSDKVLEAKYLIASEQWDRCIALGEDVLPVLIDTLKDQSKHIRTEIINLLEHIDNAQDYSNLVFLFADDSKSVRAAVSELILKKNNVLVPNFKIMVQDSKTPIRTHMDKAGKLEKEKNFGEALSHIYICLAKGEVAKTKTHMHMSAARLSAKLDNYLLSVAHYEAALQGGLDTANVHAGYARAMHKLNRDSSVVDDHFLYALEKDSKDAFAHDWYSTFLKETGKLDLAEKHSREAVSINPDNPVFLNNLALILIERNEFQILLEAKELLEKAAKLASEGFLYPKINLERVDLLITSWDNPFSKSLKNP